MNAPPLIAWMLAASLIAAGGQARAADDANVAEQCRVPAGLIDDIADFPNAAKRVARQRKLSIVAVGGASTQGLGASSPAAAWPQRLGDILAKRLDAIEITVANLGLRRQTTRMALDRVARDVAPLHPDLVIWETGTVEAAQNLDPDDYADALTQVMDKTAALHADLILMSPQYARGTALLINFQPFLDAIRQTAGLPGVNLFPRYDIMRYWDEEGRLIPRTRQEMTRGNDEIYDCIAQLLAGVIDRGLREADHAARK